nr:MAG TPA: hypothetical protein [Caudoviricetes sp.]
MSLSRFADTNQNRVNFISASTLLIAAHQDVRTVSNRLGHAQASTTMNIYAHALKENDRTASNALENMLCKTGV